MNANLNAFAPGAEPGRRPLHVRMGRIETLNFYEITEGELELLAKGSSGNLDLNFAIFLFSTAIATITALVTATFPSPTIRTIFILVSIVGVVLGAFFIISSKQKRQPLKDLSEKISKRIPRDDITTNFPTLGSRSPK